MKTVEARFFGYEILCALMDAAKFKVQFFFMKIL